MSHNFKDSLAKGKAGEDMLLKLWPDLELLDGRKHDFRLRSTGQTLELKSDQYDMNSTVNFFIEILSDKGRAKPGGPYQASLNGTNLWAYMFPKNMKLFMFKTEELMQWLMQHDKLYKDIPILNKSWITVGKKIPRADLAHLYKEYDLDVPKLN